MIKNETAILVHDWRSAQPTLLFQEQQKAGTDRKVQEGVHVLMPHSETRRFTADVPAMQRKVILQCNPPPSFFFSICNSWNICPPLFHTKHTTGSTIKVIEKEKKI